MEPKYIRHDYKSPIFFHRSDPKYIRHDCKSPKSGELFTCNDQKKNNMVVHLKQVGPCNYLQRVYSHDTFLGILSASSVVRKLCPKKPQFLQENETT